MIDQVDRELRDWIAGIVDAQVVFAAPGETPAGMGANVHLWELVEHPAPRGAQRPPLQVALRYVVSMFGGDAIECHRRLWDLIVHASRKAQASDWQVELRPPSVEFWQACGVAPRPAFVLQVPLRHEWEQPSAPRVTAPLEVGAVPQQALAGWLLGPGEIPLCGAYLELPQLGLSTYTESRGHFIFSSVPSGKYSPRQIMVRTKGRERLFDLDREAAGPLIIRFSLTED